jgi:hypothetical protein
MICAHCQRCGRRSALGTGDATALEEADPTEPAPRLRCDMCGGRRVTLFRARGPMEMIAFLSGRL